MALQNIHQSLINVVFGKLGFQKGAFFPFMENPWKVLEIRILDFWGRRALIYVLRILSGRASINLEFFFNASGK